MPVLVCRLSLTLSLSRIRRLSIGLSLRICLHHRLRSCFRPSLNLRLRLVSVLVSVLALAVVLVVVLVFSTESEWSS